MNPRHLFTGILGLAVDKNQRFLITQRNQPEHPDVHGKWQVPGGGVEFGEQPEETLHREMQEELNITPKIIHPHPLCHTQVWHHHDYSTSVTLVCYIITIGSQTPRIGDPETLDFKWLKKDELDTYPILPLTKTFVNEAYQICTAHGLWS